MLPRWGSCRGGRHKYSQAIFFNGYHTIGTTGNYPKEYIDNFCVLRFRYWNGSLAQLHAQQSTPSVDPIMKHNLIKSVLKVFAAQFVCGIIFLWHPPLSVGAHCWILMLPPQSCLLNFGESSLLLDLSFSHPQLRRGLIWTLPIRIHSHHDHLCLSLHSDNFWSQSCFKIFGLQQFTLEVNKPRYFLRLN